MDIAAGIFELIGLYVIGCKNKFGFLFNAGGNILWIIYVLLSQSTYGLLLVCIPALLLNISNYFKWKKACIVENVPHNTTKAFWIKK